MEVEAVCTCAGLEIPTGSLEQIVLSRLHPWSICCIPVAGLVSSQHRWFGIPGSRLEYVISIHQLLKCFLGRMTANVLGMLHDCESSVPQERDALDAIEIDMDSSSSMPHDTTSSQRVESVGEPEAESDMIVTETDGTDLQIKKLTKDMAECIANMEVVRKSWEWHRHVRRSKNSVQHYALDSVDLFTRRVATIWSHSWRGGQWKNREPRHLLQRRCCCILGFPGGSGSRCQLFGDRLGDLLATLWCFEPSYGAKRRKKRFWSLGPSFLALFPWCFSWLCWYVAWCAGTFSVTRSTLYPCNCRSPVRARSCLPRREHYAKVFQRVGRHETAVTVHLFQYGLLFMLCPRPCRTFRWGDTLWPQDFEGMCDVFGLAANTLSRTSFVQRFWRLWTWLKRDLSERVFSTPWFLGVTAPISFSWAPWAGFPFAHFGGSLWHCCLKALWLLAK